jgi:8-oxo-dGTP pyrophosphatase MutT (NUDIX family)
MTQPNFVAGYIVDPNAQNEPLYLLLRRSHHSYLPGIWQMVTGKLNPEEVASSTVQREILEETGLVCKEIYNVDVTIFYEQSKKHIAFSANFCAFANHLQPLTLSPNEHDKYQWCTFSEALSLLAFPAQKETLAFINKHFVLQKPHLANILKMDAVQ